MSRHNPGDTLREPPHAVLQQAAQWYARLRDGTASTRVRADWTAWLDAADDHRTAWQYVEDIGRGFEPLLEVPNPRQAAHGVCAANDRLRMRRRALAGVAALAGGGVLGWFGWRDHALPGSLMAWSADVRTGVGEQRRIVLADGSRLWLNTASAIDIRFDARQRCIRLVRGEILIETASDGSRPFLVDSAHGRMRALGTRFNVLMEDGATRLAVFGGAVEIRTAGSDATYVAAAGRQAHFTRDGITPGGPAELAREAWTRGTLVADNVPLRDIIRELGRYRHGHLGVADSIADLKVYGNFPVQDTDRVLRMLAAVLPVRVEQTMPWWTSIEPARTAPKK